MSDIEELPTWAGRALETGGVPTPQPGGKTARIKTALLALLGLIVLAGIGLAAFWVVGRGDDDAVATDAATETTVAEASDGGTATGAATAAEDDVAAPTTVTSAAPTTSTAAGTETSTGDASDSALTPPADYVSTDPLFDERVEENTRYAVVSQGQVFLYGYVPTEEISDQITEVAGGVVGPDNVITETIVDPDAPLPPDAPVFVDDKVLFAFNSVEIEPPFVPILDLGVILLSQNPNAEITIVSRTDAVGSEAANLEVSQQRAQAVVNYWLRLGIDRDRVTIDARGEQDATENDDETAAALNRSVEFRISGLFSKG